MKSKNTWKEISMTNRLSKHTRILIQYRSVGYEFVRMLPDSRRIHFLLPRHRSPRCFSLGTLSCTRATPGEREREAPRLAPIVTADDDRWISTARWISRLLPREKSITERPLPSPAPARDSSRVQSNFIRKFVSGRGQPRFSWISMKLVRSVPLPRSRCLVHL